VPSAIDPSDFIGRAPERLSLRELRTLHGWWMAFELYTPSTTPLRRIEALAPSASECTAMLIERGLKPAEYQLEMVQAPF
jgi:hypothetical protein